MPNDQIVIRGAREHNLKNIDLTLPRDKLIVITGLSGSGKSSLAFDTVYAEGQRRYVKSLSAYARQFLGQMEKPDVDHIEGLSPAISIDQKGTSKNPRSTVGTVTEIYDYLRLMYARIGHPHCPNCGREISKQSIEQIADQVLLLPEGTRLLISAPMVQGRKGEHRDVLDEAKRLGYVRARVDGVLHDLADPITLDKKFKHDIEVVVDRVIIGPELRSRLHESLEQASKLSDGLILLIPADAESGMQELLFSEEFACVYCGISMEEPAPRNFSFNNPHGACPACTGLGVRLEVDPDAVVPDPSLSIDEGALSGWTRGPSQHWMMEVLETVCRRFKIPLNIPWNELDPKERQLILYGLPKDETVRMRYVSHSGHSRSFEAGYEGVINNLQRRYRETESEWVKQEIERLMMQKPCPTCHGARLKPEYLAVTIDGMNIAEFCKHSISAALRRLDSLRLSERELTIAVQVIKEIKERLGFLHDVGLDYITIDRGAATLSGGEAQRIRLATQIGSKLMGVLYILDEPSIGLHQRDNNKLIRTLVALRDIGNTRARRRARRGDDSRSGLGGRHRPGGRRERWPRDGVGHGRGCAGVAGEHHRSVPPWRAQHPAAADPATRGTEETRRAGSPRQQPAQCRRRVPARVVHLRRRRQRQWQEHARQRHPVSQAGAVACTARSTGPVRMTVSRESPTSTR